MACVGAGNVNADVYHAVEFALSMNVPVVFASRVRHGEPQAIYGDAGGGSSLVQAGAIPSGDLSPFKAGLLLMIALGQPDMGSDELKLLFQAAGFRVLTGLLEYC